MAKDFAKKFYNSKAWQKCRESFIAQRIMIDGGMCQECGEELGYIVHHKVNLTPENINDPDISLNHNYLKYDCKKCHDKEEGHLPGARNQKSNCIFDLDGNPISIREIDISPHKNCI